VRKLLAFAVALSLLVSGAAFAQDVVWDTKGPYVDEIVLPIIMDQEAQLIALQRGDIHVLPGLTQPSHIERLMADPGIVRNRRKVEATIVNARATVALRAEGGLVALVWSFQPAATPAPRRLSEVPTSSPESVALSRELKRRGFAFVGPTTMFALMEAIGMVDTHLVGSHRRGSSGVWT